MSPRHKEKTNLKQDWRCWGGETEERNRTTHLGERLATSGNGLKGV